MFAFSVSAVSFLTLFVLLFAFEDVDALTFNGRTGAGWKTTAIAVTKGNVKDEHDNRVESVIPNGTRRALLTTALATLLIAPNGASADDTLHKVDYPVQGKCGQAQVPESAVFFVKQFGGFQEGSCAVEGYTVEEGTAKGNGEKDKERIYNIYGKS